MGIKVPTTQCQVDGLVNRFLAEDSRGQTLVLMMKQFSARRKLNLFLNMFQRRLQSMTIREPTTLYQVVGLDSRFQAEDLRGQTLVLMMKQFSARRKLNLFLNMFQRRLQSMTIKVPTTLYQVVGLDSRFQAEDLRDQTLVLMMEQFSARRKLNPFPNMFQRKLPSMMIKVHTTLFQLDGLDNKFQAEDSRDQTLVLMMKQFSARKKRNPLLNMFQRRLRSMTIREPT